MSGQPATAALSAQFEPPSAHRAPHCKPQKDGITCPPLAACRTSRLGAWLSLPSHDAVTPADVLTPSVELRDQTDRSTPCLAMVAMMGITTSLKIPVRKNSW